jgi:hypothetical protein
MLSMANVTTFRYHYNLPPFQVLSSRRASTGGAGILTMSIAGRGFSKTIDINTRLPVSNPIMWTDGTEK